MRSHAPTILTGSSSCQRGPNSEGRRRRIRAALPSGGSLIILLSLLLSAGCASRPHADPAGALDIAPSPHPRIGSLLEVDTQQGHAILRLSVLSTPLAPGTYLALDSDGQPSAALSYNGLRRGSRHGLRILAGRPEPGHTLILPAAEPRLSQLQALLNPP